MHWSRLLLAAGLILAPVLTYIAMLAIHGHQKRARDRASRPTVADIQHRLNHEASNPEPEREDVQPDEPANEASLPAGWHWPTRDHDQR